MNEPLETHTCRNPFGGAPVLIDVYLTPTRGEYRAVVRDTAIEVTDRRGVCVERAYLRWLMEGV